MKIYKNQFDDNCAFGAHIFNFIGLAYKEIGCFDDALRVFSDGANYYNFYDIYFNGSSILLDMGEIDRATEWLKKAKKIENDTVDGSIVDDILEIDGDIKYEKFSNLQVTSISNYLIDELLKLYNICNDCAHINFFLASLYKDSGNYYNALVCCLREVYNNPQDVSGFASCSRMLMGLLLNHVSTHDKLVLEFMLNARSTMLDKLSRLKETLHDKEFQNNFLKIMSVTMIYKVVSDGINEIVEENYVTNNIFELIRDNSRFKLNCDFPFIERAKKTDLVFEVFLCTKDIFDLIEYVEFFLEKNVPMLLRK